MHAHSPSKTNLVLHLEVRIPCLADHWTFPKDRVNPQGSPKYPAWVPKAMSTRGLEV